MVPVWVVADTTEIIKSGWRFESPDARLLLTGGIPNGVNVGIAEVTLLEAKNGHRELLVEMSDEMAVRASKYERAAGRRPSTPTAEEIHEDSQAYTKHWDDLLSSRGIVFLPLPTLDHRAMVKRDLARRRPFQKTGKGYRDTLLWETVLELLRAGRKPVALITGNPDDFAGDDRKTLHPHLFEDLRVQGFDA